MSEKYEEMREGDTISFKEFVGTAKINLQGLTRYIDKYIHEESPGRFEVLEILWSKVVLDFDDALRNYRFAVARLDDQRFRSLLETIEEIVTIFDELRNEQYPSIEKVKEAYLDLIKELIHLETYDLSIVDMRFENPVLALEEGVDEGGES
ncbi:hypothetical protein ACFL3C_03955 [Patescibacteria group bacterium]